jgi:hypothetical protein
LFYTPDHRSFELVVQGGRGNLMFTLQACDSIGGPVSWPDPQLEARWTNERFVLEDKTVGFRVHAATLEWKTGYF